MSIQIVSDKKNPLLQRREIEFTATGKTTASRKETRAELAKLLKADEKLIVIDYIDQKMGTNLNTGKAKVYENEEVLGKVDLAYRQKRDEGKKKEGEAAAAPAPAKK